jgi:putative sigma-54 modulation protein
MDVKINANNISMSGAMEKFINEKLSRLDRYLTNITSAVVDISQQKSNRGPDQVIVQITVRHDRGAILRAEERVKVTDNLFTDSQAAVNQAVDKMYARISRFKGKRRDKVERAGRFNATFEEIESSEEVPIDETGEFVSVPDAEQQIPLIYRRKVVSVYPMTEDEAIEQMELLGHSFFMFHHVERNRINVLYKRGNGGYGVLDPIIE